MAVCIPWWAAGTVYILGLNINAIFEVDILNCSLGKKTFLEPVHLSTSKIRLQMLFLCSFAVSVNILFILLGHPFENFLPTRICWFLEGSEVANLAGHDCAHIS